MQSTLSSISQTISTKMLSFYPEPQNNNSLVEACPHHTYLRHCINLAKLSPPRPALFRAGAVLVSRKLVRGTDDELYNDDRLLSSGYTMELVKSPHAEQACLSNYAAVHEVPDSEVGDVLPSEPDRTLVMYIGFEPCVENVGRDESCVQKIIDTRKGGRKGVEKVYFGSLSPCSSDEQPSARQMLGEAGIEWQLVEGLEREILAVATEGYGNNKRF
ncbi:putative DRAP deaminase [Aspergillus homomorphus CBS 101889]|uniref:Putative DRAP deaminase n=1 Tax=Aspergillus homomorphus (strain CBS 101889) TaxID=1450537 RepID=A0A395HPG6_ASPHC|nr:putative DRAP deaminase [Aspergillus homomorphus CBS 101889]RAL09379.1 putative DRAP deaminase [Aspergillus homomorphus CBS 101889]